MEKEIDEEITLEEITLTIQLPLMNGEQRRGWQELFRWMAAKGAKCQDVFDNPKVTFVPIKNP